MCVSLWMVQPFSKIKILKILQIPARIHIVSSKTIKLKWAGCMLFNLALQFSGLNKILCQVEKGCTRLSLLHCCYTWGSSIVFFFIIGQETHWVLSGRAIKQATDTLTTNILHNYNTATKTCGYNGKCLRNFQCPPPCMFTPTQQFPTHTCMFSLCTHGHATFIHYYKTHHWLLAAGSLEAAKGWSICVDPAFGLFPSGFLSRLHQTLSVSVICIFSLCTYCSPKHESHGLFCKLFSDCLNYVHKYLDSRICCIGFCCACGYMDFSVIVLTRVEGCFWSVHRRNKRLF